MKIKEFAMKNICRNIKAYFAYFISSTISACLIFSFTMIIFHPSFKELMLPDYLENTLNLTIVVAYLFLCFFVFYSVSIFLKRRYKEFGILYTIGASKKQVQRTICLENIIISTSSGGAGIIIGLVFSKVLFAVSEKLLGVKVMDFYFPIEALSLTFIIFILLGLIISFFCSFIIKEDRILKLIKESKKPRKEPITSRGLAILCIILLTTGYFLAITSDVNNITYRIIPVTVMVIIATYLLFSQLSVFLLRLIKENRRFYLKKINILWVSNLFYRVKNNTIMLFLIAITSAMALTAIGGVYAYGRDKEEQINSSFPEAYFIYDDVLNKNEVSSRSNYFVDLLKDKGIDFNRCNGKVKFVNNLESGN